MKLYKVGGYVRDQILGIPSKDIDYAIEAESYEAMKLEFVKMGGTIFVENPEYVTIRGKLNNEPADFVLCRKDGYYSDSRRPDDIQPGTLYDDLARRDFTVNAIAIDEHGNYIDPFGGIDDIKKRVIRCVGSVDRIIEDSLRMLRALRFAITKDFLLDNSVHGMIETHYELIKKISRERIYEELKRMLDANTSKTFQIMSMYPDLFKMIFTECNVGLTSTLPSLPKNGKL